MKGLSPGPPRHISTYFEDHDSEMNEVVLWYA
eukprot:CAMPEP_0119105382 /NCGR_PEP_ID=MMETSP1180-20130426/3355_1 /TAXON_ID=3052 ORGANISM="Chlamydomonas cf sp, Strain CCMP681" /NCGR_SAMPLE_ID=MMETSP1180 /ASSEMBLY_ACC=CAM_ASM_000741 /LENGTH=31 /DNA_ID= /DNA_START= /DNA_END= /DNA_ORIENTATION=